MMRDAMGPLIDKATGQPVPRIQPTKSIEQKQLEALERIESLLMDMRDMALSGMTPREMKPQGVPKATAEAVVEAIAESRRGPKGKRR
jgi:hypothetical protein